MILADGSAKPFRGKETFELKVEGKRTLQEVWVADIELEGILGMDFVRRFGCQIIAASGGQLELFIPEMKSGSGSGMKPAEVMELSNYQCLRVVVENTVSVPANSEMLMAAKVLDKCGGGLKSTLDSVQYRDFLVGRSPIQIDGPIPIRFLNPTSCARWVYENTLAALCESVDENEVRGEPWLREKETDVLLARESEPKECEHQDQQRSLPLELEELLNRRTDDLDKQIGVLTDLLHERQEVFATFKNPFRRTSITQHMITTGESKLIKQAPKRHPLHLKEKTEDEIQKMLGSSRDVKAWCRNCSCSRRSSRRKPQKKFQVPLQVYKVGVPLEGLTIDVWERLRETDKGNRYILVVMDYFSKWVEALAMPEQSAETVAYLLVIEVISSFGVPLQIHTDQGRNVESGLFKEVCRLLDIEKTRTAPLHPQSDGMAELLSRILEAMLFTFFQKSQRNWNQILPLLAMVYRSAIHESNGCTPTELMFGRVVRLPVDLMFGSPPVPVAPPDSAATDRSDYVTKGLEQIPIGRGKRCGCITTEQARQKPVRSCKLQEPRFPQGKAQVRPP